MYTLLIAIIYLAFISLGLPDSLLGSAWPVIYSDIGVPLSYMGILTMIVSGCTIISSLMSDRLTRKLGTCAVTIVSVFLTAVALLGYSFADSFVALVLLSVPYGLGAGAIDAALNNYVAVHYSAKHMSWLHCFWGVGTIISPSIMSYALTHYSWSTGYRIVAVLQLAIGAAMLLSIPLWKVNGQGGAQEKDSDGKALGIPAAIKIPGVPSLLLAFFGYCAMESTATSWAATYLVEAKNLDEASAAAFGALVFLGITVGRFIGGFLMDKLGNLKMIRLGTAIIACGLLILIFSGKSTVVSVIGLGIVGLGCAPIYPCIINSTPSNFGTENSGAIIGIQMASAYIGTTFMSPLFGLLAKSMGFELYPVYMLIFLALLTVMVNLTFKITSKPR